MKYYYNLNGLLTFSIDAHKKKLDYINRQYCYFKQDSEIKNVDMEVIVGPFDKIRPPYQVVNRKYFVTQDCIYAEDSYKVARWRFMIEGLKEKKTRIYFDGNFWSYYILYKFFIEPVLRYKLNSNGFFMIHSSSVATSEGAFVFPASPSVGKTSTMLNWLNEGKDFMADEFTILSQDAVYSYPTPLRLHDYNLTANPFIKKDMSQRDKFQIYLRTWILRLTLGYGDVTHEVNIWDVFPKVKICDKSRLNKIVIFTKYSGEDVQIEEMSASELIDRLIIINRFETSRFTDYLQAYEYVTKTKHKDGFWEKMRENGGRIFQEKQYYAFNIPQKYTRKTFDQINDGLKILHS